MRTVSTAFIALALLSATAWAQAYRDAGTSAWFKSLKIPLGKYAGYSCCDQSDCHPTPAEFRDGQWWALTREGKEGEEIPIPPDRVDPDHVSPFEKDGIGLAVLCEAKSGGVTTARVVGTMGTPVLVYCYVIPPNFT